MKPLGYYRTEPGDGEIFLTLEMKYGSLLQGLSDPHKLNAAWALLAALMWKSPETINPELLQLIRELTPQGKLDLAKALLDSVGQLEGGKAA